MKTFVVAGGCFWCIDAVYRRLKGVQSVVSGYAGGTADEADYYSVASGQTGHAEAVQVTFDETVIPESVILDVFFTIHDPTSRNRQGADSGPQYRSALFYADEEQEKVFQTAIETAKPLYEKPIVTSLEPLDAFYAAEPEHQDYYDNNPMNPYCPVVISPKVKKARTGFANYFKEDQL